MKSSGYAGILRTRPFRLFWLGFTFSVLGDALSGVALTWLVYDRTRSAEALGWLTFCYTAPILAGGLAAGWLLDRFDRRRVMIADNVIRGFAFAMLPLASMLGLLSVGLIYAVASIYGLLMMISLAGSPALVPDLVSRDQLATANALETLSWTIGGVIGPSVAGVLIGWIGPQPIIWIDALSYGVFAVLLASIRVPGGSHTVRAASQSNGIGDALRLLARQPILLSTTAMYFVFNIAVGLKSVWLPIMADVQLQGGAALFGTLLALEAAGETVGAVVGGTRAFSRALGRQICVALVLCGLALAIPVLVPTVAGVGFALILFGACSAPLTIWAQTLRMQIIPADLRGRAFALLRMLMQAGRPAGGTLGGMLVPWAGMTTSVLVSATAVGLAGLAGAAIPALRQAHGDGSD